VTLLEQLVAGRVVSYQVTLIEGWRFVRLREELALLPEIVHESTQLTAAEIMVKLGHPGGFPEGRFFPDTYQYHKGDSDLQILAQAYAAMEQHLQREWATRAPDLPYSSPDEALILASIVEKESGAEAERAEIAGVFVRRLRLGMRLQSDPTVIYAVGADYDGNITRRHLKLDRPHNTYVRYGLPPTPIASPGLAALQAVMHPAAGDRLYFVGRGDGTHHFSATLAEHNRAVNYYQLGRGAPPVEHHE